MASKQYTLEVNYAVLGSTEDIERMVSEIPAEDATWQVVGIVDFVQGGSIATFNFKAKTKEGAFSTEHEAYEYARDVLAGTLIHRIDGINGIACGKAVVDGLPVVLLASDGKVDTLDSEEVDDPVAFLVNWYLNTALQSIVANIVREAV